MKAAEDAYPEFRLPPASPAPNLPAGEQRRRVVFVASRTSDPLELIGPVTVLNVANFVLQASGRPDHGYALEIVTTRPGRVFAIDGLKITAERRYDQLRGRVDTLLFAPMDMPDLLDRSDHFLGWVRRWSKRVRRVGTICFGTYILAEAGVLDGRRATTHWNYAAAFRLRYPRVTLDIERIYVKDGHIYTSAGATSGIDMMLALIEEDFGHPTALRVAQALLLFVKRPGDQAQFSVQLSTRLPQDDAIAAVQSHIHDHPEVDLRIETLAERARMSPRNFARVFRQEVGMAPGRYVELARLEAARRCLQESNLSVAQIARRVGFASADGMRLAFERNLGVAPRAYRQRFARSR